jgi:hypothetical protein
LHKRKALRAAGGLVYGGSREIEIVSQLGVKRRERDQEKAFGRKNRHHHDE